MGFCALAPAQNAAPRRRRPRPKRNVHANVRRRKNFKPADVSVSRPRRPHRAATGARGRHNSPALRGDRCEHHQIRAPHSHTLHPPPASRRLYGRGPWMRRPRLFCQLPLSIFRRIRVHRRYPRFLLFGLGPRPTPFPPDHLSALRASAAYFITFHIGDRRPRIRAFGGAARENDQVLLSFTNP